MLAGSAGGALAQQAASPTMPAGEIELTYEQIAFDAADTNGDGVVSEGELARDAAVGFATLDKDGSMTLTPAELGPHDPALFARNDRSTRVGPHNPEDGSNRRLLRSLPRRLFRSMRPAMGSADCGSFGAAAI